MRHGTPSGVTSSCRLYLPLWRGRETDWSGQGGTATRVGNLRTVEGYYGWGLRLVGVEGLSVANASAINVTTAASLDLWFKPEATGTHPIAARIDQTGSQNDAWRLWYVLDSTGLTRSLWMVRMETAASDTAGMIADLLRDARGGLAPEGDSASLPHQRRIR